MGNNLLFGIAVGVIVGAVLAVNNKKVEDMVHKGKQATKKFMKAD